MLVCGIGAEGKSNGIITLTSGGFFIGAEGKSNGIMTLTPGGFFIGAEGKSNGIITLTPGGFLLCWCVGRLSHAGKERLRGLGGGAVGNVHFCKSSLPTWRQV